MQLEAFTVHNNFQFHFLVPRQEVFSGRLWVGGRPGQMTAQQDSVDCGALRIVTLVKRPTTATKILQRNQFKGGQFIFVKGFSQRSTSAIVLGPRQERISWL